MLIGVRSRRERDGSRLNALKRALQQYRMESRHVESRRLQNAEIQFSFLINHFNNFLISLFRMTVNWSASFVCTFAAI